METKNLAELIKKAGKSKRVGEFKCPYISEFYVSIAHASKFILTQIREVARETWTNPRTREREEKFNDDKLRKEYSRQIVINWRGLTAEKLQHILPGLKIVGKENTDDIPYSSVIAEAILEVSLEFENWAIDIATNVENYSHIAEEKGKELENLK